MSGLLASIPSPSRGVWHLGVVPVRAYALCILLGIVVAVVVTDRRWRARGGLPDQVSDIALWAVPFGIVGGRLYHVLSSPGAYFGAGGDPVRALFVWQGGLGIWGAVALGGLGAWIGCRRTGASLPAFADALAPGLLLAQGIGRFGNWFNQELYGRPTDLPWALRIDPAHREPGYADVATYHPTFLYEALWDAVAALVLVALGRRLSGRRALGHGRAFAAYVVLYCLGRVWIEALRIDPAERVLGLRLNVWTCLLVGLAGAVAYAVSARRHPGAEATPLRGAPAAPAAASTAAPAAAPTAATAPGGTGTGTGAAGTARGRPTERDSSSAS